jgi:arylsulfatase A-like enzyme
LVDATLRVPLILAVPGVPAAVRVDPVSLIDVMPTLLSALGLPVPDDVDGRDLLTGPFEADRSLYSETFYEKGERAETGAEAASLRDGRFVLLSRPAGVQLFDLSSDPSERVDVSREYPERLAALRAELEALRESWAQSTPSRALDLDPEEEADHHRRLKALGYVE